MSLAALFLLLSALAVSAQPILRSGWTTNNTPVAARQALGIYETNAAAYNVTNTFTNFSVPSLTIGTGTNAVTLGPTNGTVTVGPAGVLWSVPEVVAGAMTLNGDRITAWPMGGGGGGGILTNGAPTQLYLSFYTNGAPVSALTNLGLFTNGFASASWGSTNGSVLSIEFSTNGVDNWTSAIDYDGPAYLRLVTQLAGMGGGTEYVTNFSILSVLNLDSVGFTNDYTRQVLTVAPPTGAQDATPKAYVDTTATGAAKAWATHSAVADVRLLRRELQLSGEWALRTSVTSNELRCVLQFGGMTIAEFSPGFIGLTNATISPVATNDTVLTVRVLTNGITGPLRLLMATNIITGPWRFVTATNSYPTAVGTNYTLTVPLSLVPSEAYFYAGRSNAPAYKLPAATLP